MIQRGDLVRWINEEHHEDAPCVVVKDPHEGYFDKKPWTEITIVVDLMIEGKIIRNIPLSEVQPWVIDHVRSG